MDYLPSQASPFDTVCRFARGVSMSQHDRAVPFHKSYTLKVVTGSNSTHESSAQELWAPAPAPERKYQQQWNNGVAHPAPPHASVSFGNKSCGGPMTRKQQVNSCKYVRACICTNACMNIIDVNICSDDLKTGYNSESRSVH